jgi:NTP pyrophosphatase (non-canonical NTP hydrolase)
MNYKQLIDATHQWALDRKIVENGKTFTQTMKLISEFGELCDGIIKDRPHEIKDAIGDMMVVISNIASIKGEQWRTFLLTKCKQPVDQPLPDFKDDQRRRIYQLLEKCQCFLEKDWTNGFDAPRHLKVIAAAEGLTLEECWESAYNEIKDRKGYLNEFGNFIKEGDV